MGLSFPLVSTSLSAFRYFVGYYFLHLKNGLGYVYLSISNRSISSWWWRYHTDQLAV